MECKRCHGLMVQDRAYDLQDTSIHCDVLRCVCCGHMFDTMILMNQMHPTSPLTSAPAAFPLQTLTAA